MTTDSKPQQRNPRYDRVLAAFFGQVWGMLPEKFEQMREVLQMRIEAGQSALDEDEFEEPRREPERRGKIAVLPLYGVIAQRMNLMMTFSGGTSTEIFGAQLDRMVADRSVSSIVIDIESPGGSVFGVPELAEKIYNARGAGKPIVAVANAYAASAAYWIGAAADELVVTPSGKVGSIGVYALHVDYSRANEMEGVKPTYIHAGRFKVEGNPDEPLGETARDEMQRSVDQYYEMFTEAVARFRGVSVDVARGELFGEGRLVSARQAVHVRMADAVATRDEVINRLAGKNKGSGRGARTSTARRRLDLAEKHGTA